jgi:hypothetical protein
MLCKLSIDEKLWYGFIKKVEKNLALVYVPYSKEILYLVKEEKIIKL